MQRWEYLILVVSRKRRSTGVLASEFIDEWRAWGYVGGELVYNTSEDPAPTSDTAGHLSKMGHQGWELTGLHVDHAIFAASDYGLQGSASGPVQYTFWMKRPTTS